TIFSRDWSSDMCSSDLALGEVDGCDDPDPGVLHIVETDEVLGVVFIARIAHAAVVADHRRVVFGYCTQILDAYLFDAAVSCEEHLAAAPTVLDSIHDRRSEEHTSELQSRENLVCRLLLEKKNEKTVAH